MVQVLHPLKWSPDTNTHTQETIQLNQKYVTEKKIKQPKKISSGNVDPGLINPMVV